MGDTKKGNVRISRDELEDVLGGYGAGYTKKGSNHEREMVLRSGWRGCRDICW